MNRYKDNNKENNWNHAFADFIVTLGVLLSCSIVSATIHEAKINGGTNAATMIFVLGVFVIARLTNGYIWGIISSFLGVVIVNFIFTYPYYKINFSITGYPLTFLTMLIVSVITSATATQAKQQEQLRIDNEKERIMGNLLRSVSHDIRTPLTSIVGSTSVLLDDENKLSKDQRRQLLQDVHDDGEWLINVTENILSITKVDSENKIIKQNELIDELVETSIRKFEKRHHGEISIEATLPDEPLLVPMDMMLMEQVVTNILENAINHGKNLTFIKISINSNNDFVYIHIENDGIPIDESKLHTLFSGAINQDVNATSKNGKRYMGIGLSVCHTIVKAHDGNIEARNIGSDKGVEFIISLPI